MLNVCVASRRSAAQTFWFELFLVADEANPALYVTDYFVRAFDEGGKDVFPRHAIGVDAISVPLDRRCELFKRHHALPLQPRAGTFGELLPRHKTRLVPLGECRRRGRKFIAPRHENVARI